MDKRISLYIYPANQVMKIRNYSYRITADDRIFLRKLFMHAPVVYCDFNRFFRLSCINEEGILVAGNEFKEGNYRLPEIIPKTDPVWMHWKRKEGSRNTAELCIHTHGSGAIYLICLWWIVECEGRFDGIACIGFDTRKYHQILDELQKNNEQFRQFAQLLPETVFEIDLDGNFLFLNESSYKVFGYSKTDKINAFDMFVPEELPRMKENMKRILSGEILKGNAYQARRKDGTTFPVLIYSVPNFQGNRPAGFRGFIVDITNIRRAEEALQQSEEKYRSLTNRLPVGIYRTTREGKLLFANPAFIEMLGYNTFEEISSEPVQNLYDNPEEREKILQSLYDGQEFYETEVYLKKRDGTRIIVRDRGRVYKSNDNQIFYEGILVDISETRILEEKLKQAEKLQAIGTLAGGIAHDFNNLIMGMQLYTEMALKQAGENTHLHKSLEKVLIAQERGKQLVQQILSFSNYPDHPWEDVNLKDALADILELISDTIPEEIAFEKDLQDCGIVSMNPMHLHQIIQNLITNAIHAMQGKGNLRISLSYAEQDALIRKIQGRKDRNRYAVICVEDTGCGIDRKTMDRIFEPFFTTKDVGLGTGLGLYIVHNLVKKYNGDIQVKSQPGEGTTMKIFLPVTEINKQLI